MESSNAIEIKNVSKKFKVYFDKGPGLKEKILFKNRNHYEERLVLNNISFSIKKGESVGLIGKNGCGKSTTLKLLAKIIYPNSGTVDMKGRVSSLIELGAGFHPDLSGRENIYTNASIFGLTKKEINDRIDKIIEFSELEEFLDNPVRTYSSGMYMRLAFSVAINVDADILLIDEILAVGDMGFQQKCMEKLKEIKASGTTIVIVSHSLGQIEQICDRTIWIENGKIREDGTCREVHNNYQNAVENENPQFTDNKRDKKIELEKNNVKLPQFCDPKALSWGNRKVRFTDVVLKNAEGKICKVFESDDLISIDLKYESEVEGLKANFGIAIYRNDGLNCFGTHLGIEKNMVVTILKHGWIRVSILQIHLLPGSYFLDVGVISEKNDVFEEIKNVKSFDIISNIHRQGICNLDTLWTIDGTVL